MEQRLINYTKGVTRSPGDLMAEDGELLECINLKCEGGELRPLLWPKEAAFTLTDGEELLYVHKGSGYKSYFVGSGSTVNAFHVTTDGTRKDYTFSHTFKGTVKFESIGNTVIAIDGNGLHYILYKNSDYIYLGQHFPECPLSFGLQGDLKYYSKINGLFTVSFAEEIEWSDYYTKPFTDSNKKAVTEQVLAKVNQFIKEESTDKGRFMFPFLVRYAYRLYDGTLTYHSAPVLMVASSYPNPYVPVLGNLTEGDGEPKEGAVCDVVGVASQLDYALLDESVKETLRNWGDIIKSVDIFISAPIYTYNQNGSIDRFVNTAFNGTTNALYISSAAFVGKIVGGDRPDGKDFSGFPSEEGVTGGDLLSAYYQRWNIVELYQSLRRVGTGQLYAELPLYDRSVTDESVKSCSQFYFLKSIRVGELSTDRIIIPVASNYFQSLQSRELMSDDYRSHDRISSESVYVYNGRLNMYGINRELFSGWNPATLYQYTNGAVDVNLDTVNKVVNPTFTDVSSSYCGNLDMQTLVGESGEVWFPVQSTTGQNFDLRETGLYTFFPNNQAIGFLVGGIASENFYLSNYSAFNFDSHRFLNGAVHFFGLGRRVGSSVQFQEEADVPVLSESGKIYTSEVNNPFVFPAGGVNTVGTGDVIGLVSTTKALSQGQFGQFPLLALTTDGIWAMTVNDEGLYSTKQVVSRDVCNNADSIVQTDNLVFFSSEKGLMAIDGANVTCVSDHLRGMAGSVQDMSRIDGMLSGDYAMVKVCDDGKEFREYLKGCEIGFSYRDSVLYIANESFSYVWVYDIKGQTLTKLYKQPVSGVDAEGNATSTDVKVTGFVNDYADTLMKTNVGVYSLLSEPDMTGDAQAGFAMTRSLKLGNPTSKKGIWKLRNLKNVTDAESSVKYGLWGSNNGMVWHFVGGSDGGFKYYRMGLFTKLKPTESVLGSVIVTEEKRGGKMV